MVVTLTVCRYKTWSVPFALMAMMVFRIPLLFNKKISFYKLMGSGKNGTFDKRPDWNQWAIFCCHRTEDISFFSEDHFSKIHGKFIFHWCQLFCKENYSIVLTPVMGHGFWDGKEVFGKLKSSVEFEGPIATLTRATIRLSKLRFFWKNVAPVAQKMSTAPGFLFSLGIGEIPWIKQATFSIWDSIDSMKAFAYGMKEHAEVIKKTKQQKWYSEDLFVRFKIEKIVGKINPNNPLKRIP